MRKKLLLTGGVFLITLLAAGRAEAGSRFSFGFSFSFGRGYHPYYGFAPGCYSCYAPSYVYRSYPRIPARYYYAPYRSRVFVKVRTGVRHVDRRNGRGYARYTPRRYVRPVRR